MLNNVTRKYHSEVLWPLTAAKTSVLRIVLWNFGPIGLFTHWTKIHVNAKLIHACSVLGSVVLNREMQEKYEINIFQISTVHRCWYYVQQPNSQTPTEWATWRMKTIEKQRRAGIQLSLIIIQYNDLIYNNCHHKNMCSSKANSTVH